MEAMYIWKVTKRKCRFEKRFSMADGKSLLCHQLFDVAVSRIQSDSDYIAAMENWWIPISRKILQVNSKRHL